MNKNSSDTTGNTNTTTESICPKGWTLPTTKQLDSQRDVNNFYPVMGGYYYASTLYNEATRGYWWGSEAQKDARRYNLANGDNSYLYTGDSYRHVGVYIRCVSEEKTVTDLTYLQDMTGEIANNTLDGTTASLTDRRDGKLYAVAKINGNMWMTQNLRFGYDSTNGAGNPTPGVSSLILTPDDSNIVLSADRLNPHGTPNDPSDDVAETVDGYRELTTYDLVTYGPSGKECYGSYNSTSGTGWGPGYENNCIHSGTIVISGDLPTNWYNYTLATAGTIIDENTTSSSPATNTTTATESICPKGWTLPSKTQIDSQRNASSFSPVLGGNYENGTLYNEDAYGHWWGSTAYNGALHCGLRYNGSSLYTYNYRRPTGLYVRCVQAP